MMWIGKVVADQDDGKGDADNGEPAGEHEKKGPEIDKEGDLILLFPSWVVVSGG